MKDQVSKKVSSLFRLALAGLIKPDHVFPVILVFFSEGEITEDELVELQKQTELVEKIDKTVRDLKNRRKKKKPPVLDRMLRKVALELVANTRPFGEQAVQVLKKRIMKDLGLSAKQLKG